MHAEVFRVNYIDIFNYFKMHEKLRWFDGWIKGWINT